MNKTERYDLPFFGHHPQDMGMPPSSIADKIALYEQLYKKWLGTSWWRRFIVTKIARVPCSTFRMQVYELMLYVSQTIRDTFAAQQQEDARAAANMTMAHVRRLREFLYEEFPADLQEADAANRPLIEQAQIIMLRFKREGRL